MDSKNDVALKAKELMLDDEDFTIKYNKVLLDIKDTIEKEGRQTVLKICTVLNCNYSDHVSIKIIQQIVGNYNSDIASALAVPSDKVYLDKGTMKVEIAPTL